MIQLTAPLQKMRLTQPYGVNWVDPGFYRSVGIPSDMHNGWDLKAVYQPLYAPCDGVLNSYETVAGGSSILMRTPMSLDGTLELEQFFCHLKEAGATGQGVKRGEQIGITGDSGTACKGPHLHYGIRLLKNGAVVNYSNGYHGFVDPTEFYPKDVFDLPVDKCYGNRPSTPGVPTELAFYKHAVYFWRTVGRLPTVRERNALRFGFWDLRTVLDPAMFPIWSERSKPEAIRQGIIKP